MDTMSWDGEFSDDESLEILDKLASAHAIKAGEAGTVAHDLIRRRDYRALAELQLEYLGDERPDDLLNLRQSLAFYQKNRDLPVQVDREQAAYSKFAESERACALTNECFTAWDEGRFQFRPFVESVLHTAQRKISQILGEAPQIDELRLRFGPGATSGITKRMASARTKLSSALACSTNMISCVPELLRSIPGMVEHHQIRSYELIGEDGDTYEVGSIPLQIHDGKLSFVTKNFSIFRIVVPEPILNGMTQLGIGDYQAEKLKIEGVDISDQKPNQLLAREGSLTGALATLDLSSASDCNACGLVRHLLSDDWYNLLSGCRTPYVRYRGNRIRLEKFSSMGNGYTFALETLIFYAIVWSVRSLLQARGPIRVYGDDIICPSSMAECLAGVLADLGFTVNAKKSFWRGPFRESCGADYFRGIDIRPCYIKRRLRVCDLFVLHNFYVKTLQTDMADMVLKYVPSDLRLWGPSGFGDGHLHSENWAGKIHRRDRGWGGYTFDTFTFVHRTLRKPLPGDWMYPSYSIYMKEREVDEVNLEQEVLSRVPGHLKRIPGINEQPFWLELSKGVWSICTHQEEQLPKSKKRKEAVWNTTLPGVKGVKRISIYTLVPPGVVE